jgi:hypothetical protein
MSRRMTMALAIATVIAVFASASFAAGPSKRYRVVILGFEVTRQTWDDALQSDGKNDEILIRVSNKYVNKNGDLIGPTVETQSKQIGDPNGFPGRVPWVISGAEAHSGLRTGDAFPHEAPWVQQVGLDPARNYPPYVIWEDVLEKGESMVFITPTIWEWDDGAGGVLSGWLDWVAETDMKFGTKAKEIFSGRWPGIGWIFDAVSLGIQTAATLNDCGNPLAGC